MIQKCPFINELDVDLFADYFMNFYKGDMTSMIVSLRGLTVFPECKATLKGMEKLISLASVTDLERVLSSVYPEQTIVDWEFDVCCMREIISKIIFRRIIDQDEYNVFCNSRHLRRLAEYALEKNEIDGLVKALYKVKKVAACEIIYQHYRMYPSEAVQGVVDKDRMVEIYLETLHY